MLFGAEGRFSDQVLQGLEISFVVESCKMVLYVCNCVEFFDLFQLKEFACLHWLRFLLPVMK